MAALRTLGVLAACLAASASGFGAPRVTPSRVGSAPQRRALALAAAGGEEPPSPPADGQAERDELREGSELAKEFELAWRRKTGLEEIRAREKASIDALIDSQIAQIQAVKDQMDIDLARSQAATNEALRQHTEAALRAIDAKADEAQRIGRAQFDAILRGESPASIDGAARGAAGGAAGARAGERVVRSVVLVGAGGPLMRAVARQLSGSVRVRAVIAGDAAKRDSRGLAPWPRAPAGARPGGNGAAGAGDASGGGEALGFELVDTTAEPPSRFAVQRAMDGADSVLFCLVDGERREWCLDEQAARRWVEGAGGPTPPPDGVPSLPVPVKVENVAGRLLLVASAHGTNRAGVMPYALQNVWGQLDAWRRVEQDAQLGAKGRGFDWCVAHLGKLLPPTDKGAEGSGPLTVAPGDSLSAPIALDTAADGLARVLRGAVPAARNASFSLHAEGVGARADAAWADEFLKLDGPELARLPLRADADARATLLWLRDFGVSLTKPGRDALPTPAQALPTDDGVKIVFLKSGFELSRGFADKDAAEERAAAGGAGGTKGGASGEQPEQVDAGAREALRAAALRGRPDGALLLQLEQAPAAGGPARVRVVRQTEEGAVIKETSEGIILARLTRELPSRA